ncbi:hypothetical protein BDQ12DRAFT_693650, partial [Crucibulum laeve]
MVMEIYQNAVAYQSDSLDKLEVSDTTHSPHVSSDESSSEDERMTSQPVYLTLYEEEEAQHKNPWAKARNRAALSRDHNHPDGTVFRDPLSGNTCHHISRLFDSIKGYHEASLDLTGRHPSRYYSLQARWNKFLFDFLALNISGMERRDSKTGLCQIDFVVNDKAWERFRVKWRLPCAMHYSQLLDKCRLTLKVLKENPIPRFQKLHLLNLPAELLDHIFRLSSTSDARVLACTCYILNSVGRRHIFRNLRLKLRLPHYVSSTNAEYSSHDIPTIAQYARRDLLKNFNFLLDRPSLTKQIQALSIIDEWWLHGQLRQEENLPNPFSLSHTFYEPLSKMCPRMLQATSNLTELTLGNLKVSGELIRALADASSLHTLTFHLCRFSPEVQTSILSNDLPPSLNIANVHILMDSDAPVTHTQWYALALFPNIRTLSIKEVGHRGFPLPSSSTVRERCYIHKLERLSLENIDASEIEAFSEWIRLIRSAYGLNLTHFKLHAAWGIPDTDIIGLLQALEGAPLQLLVLEGLSNAEFPVLDSIANLFPELLGLTLVRRHNDYQYENKLAVWPHASWEYASHFQQFTKLRHFCWNFWTDYFDVTPAPLVAFENGFAVAGDEQTGDEGEDENGVVDCDDSLLPYFLDSHWSAMPFAAYCPSLETYSVMNRTIDMTCRITRHSETGRRIVEPAQLPPPFACRNPCSVRQWNTVGLCWPPLPPMSPHVD